MSKKIIFKGSATALVTPFSKGKIDFKTFEKNIKWQTRHNADALVVCGTTGEGATLSDCEKSLLTEIACSESGAVPVIVGTGSNDTYHAVTLSKEAERSGAAALLVVTPYYNKTNQEGIVEHYKAIASKVDLPIIVYNVPSRTGLDIAPETYTELSAIPNVVAVKEASGNIIKAGEITRRCGERLFVYSGNDEFTYHILALGGIGVISTAANIVPDEMHKICELYFRKKHMDSLALQEKLADMINALFSDVNPLPLKYAMCLLGLCSSETRPPLYELSDAAKKKVSETVSAYFGENKISL